MNGVPKGGPLTLAQCRELQDRVASLEAALRTMMNLHAMACPDCVEMEQARAALAPRSERREGEP